MVAVVIKNRMPASGADDEITESANNTTNGVVPHLFHFVPFALTQRAPNACLVVFLCHDHSVSAGLRVRFTFMPQAYVTL
jgi:hypothetical protein